MKLQLLQTEVESVVCWLTAAAAESEGVIPEAYLPCSNTDTEREH